MPAEPHQNKRAIDPAALIFATLALLGTTLYTSGPFSPLTSLLGVVLLLVIYAYDEDEDRDLFQKLAFSTVTGLALTVALGLPAQLLNWLPVPKDCVEVFILGKLEVQCPSAAAAAEISWQIQCKLVVIWIHCASLAFACEFTRNHLRRRRHRREG